MILEEKSKKNAAQFRGAALDLKSQELFCPNQGKSSGYTAQSSQISFFLHPSIKLLKIPRNSLKFLYNPVETVI